MYRTSFKSEVQSSYREYDTTDCDLIGHQEQEVQINIYESDDEEKRSTPNSRSPNVTRSLLSQDREELAATSSPEIELKLMNAVGNKKLDMNKFELEEKYHHYKRTSEQYEKLYAEYLEKFILTKREKEMLIFRQRRVNALIGQTAWLQAKWDSLAVI